jgi:hypothetical protein
VATDYQAQLASQSAAANVAARVKRGQQIWSQLGPWIDKYRGGFPAGFAAAIIQWESNGDMSATGDASLGEAGYFQVTSTFPPSVGIPAEARLKPEVNVFLGLLEYQIEAVKLAQAEPLIELGTIDSWKLARLAFSIGSYGARTLVQEAKPTERGKVYDAVRAYVDRIGGRAFGSQSAPLVWYRVHTNDLVWNIGQQIRPGDGGPPQVPPAPPGYTFTVPPLLLPLFSTATAMTFVAIAALALGAFYLLRRL